MGDDNIIEESRFMKKIRDQPFVPIGLAGLLGVVTYSFYNLKTKKQKLSIYLIHTRVAAQGVFISCLTLGLIYSMVKTNINKLFPEKKD